VIAQPRSEELHAIWVHARDVAEGVMPAVALDRLRPPDLHARLLSSTGDTITVEVVEGVLPMGDDLLYVERRGPYEVARRETWPGQQVLLTLAAWPRR
jgi:hypothetical protein